MNLSSMLNWEILLAFFWPVFVARPALACSLVVTGDEWVIVAGSFLTTPLGLINSPRLLEHQVTANRGPDAAKAGPTASTLPQFQFRTSGAHSWVLKEKQKPNSFRNTASPLTLHSFPQLALSWAKKSGIRYFFSFLSLLDMIINSRQKPLET